jgi:hypothetical protein
MNTFILVSMGIANIFIVGAIVHAMISTPVKF